MDEATPPAAGRTLRLALAMRGGVSLAVWIGGAVAEIDLLRRATASIPDDPEGEPPRKAVYRRMLEVAGYEAVEVDILAGASAGGLNAVIYGFAQSVGRTTDWAEEVWCDLGSLWRLLRPTPPGTPWSWPGRLRVPSLLQGDDYFYVELCEELLRQLDGVGSGDGGRRPVRRARPADYVSVDLSATLAARPRVPPVLPDAPRRTAVGWPPRPAERSAVHFRFAGRPADPLSPFTDLPGPDPDPVDGSDAPRLTREQKKEADERAAERALQVGRLAYAGRATSSFPGAFEPATVGTTLDEQDRPRPVPTEQKQEPPHMRGVFSENGPEPYAVVDGGIFDNVPIGRALDAVAAAGASGPTERRLVFLDPSPGPRPEPARMSERPPDRGRREAVRRTVADWIPTIVRAIGLKVREENSGEEIDLVRRHNQVVALERARLEVLATELAGCPTLAPRLALARARYVDYRVVQDAGHLALLLTRPSATLLRASTAPVRSPRAMDERDALRLDGELAGVYGRQPDRLSAPLLHRDAVALVETAAMLVAWCREVEDLCGRTGEPVPVGLAAEEHAFSRVLDVGRHLRDLADTALVTTVQGDIELVVAGVGAARAAQCGWSTAKLSDLHGLSETAFWSAMTTTFRAPVGDRPPTRDVSLLDSLWQQLADGRAAVVTCCGATVDALGPADDRWGRSIFAQLHHAPLADLCLHDLHVVLAAAGGGPGTASHIRYHEITGDQPTPLAPLLGRVVAAERRRRVTELLRDDRLDPATEFDRDPFRGARPLVDAGSKLAGNSLANFSAFLARDWRAHDWRWGRLDAAAGMVDVVLDTARAGDVEALSGEFVDKPPPGVDRREWAAWIRPGPGEAPAAVVRRALCARLQYEVLGEAPRDRPDGSLRTAVAVMDRPKARLGDLRRRYLFGLASRMLHLSYRGMWPSTWTFPTSMGRLAMIALRPLLVCLPLLAAPERALLALVGIAWLAPLASDGDVVAPDVGPWALGTGAVVLLACGLIGVVRAGAAWRRWSQIEEAVPAPAPDVGWTEVSAWSRDGRRRVAALAVAAVAVLAWAGYLLFRLAVGDTASPWSPSVLSIVVVALAGLAATAWVNTVPTPATRAAAVRLGPYAVVVVAVAVVGVAALHLPAVAAVTAVVPAVWQVVGVTAAVAALLYDGWACWLPHGLLAVGASAALGAVVATAPWFGGPWPPMWAAVAGVVGVAVVAAGLLTPRDVDAADELAA